MVQLRRAKMREKLIEKNEKTKLQKSGLNQLLAPHFLFRYEPNMYLPFSHQTETFINV